MGKTLAGQPLWLWGLGAAVVVGGYLWIRHSQSTASTSGGTGTGSTATPQSTSSFTEWIKQHNASPKKKAKTTKTKTG